MTTYYVDARNGSDSNEGTSEASAFASLDKVNSLSLQPGDTVLFARDSVFQGGLNLTSSGISGAPIAFGAYGTGEDPVFTGGQNGVAGNGHDYILVRDIDITNQSGAGIISFDSTDWRIDNIDVDTVGTAYVPGNNEFSAFQFRDVANLTIENSSYKNVNGDGVFLWNADSVKILNNEFAVPQGPTSDNIHSYRMSNYEIRGNVMDFSGSTDSGKGNMVVQESSNGVIADNTFIMTGNAHYGIGGTIQNGIIENNQFIGRAEGTWSTALNVTEGLGDASTVTNMTIRNNFFDGSGMGIYTWDGNGAGTAYRNDFNVTGNIFKDLRDPAIVAEAPVQLNGSFSDNALVNTADPNLNGTEGAWSTANNVYTSDTPAWAGGAEMYAPAQVITGADGSDALTGTDGADTIWGDRQQDGPAGGNDMLSGGAGNDYLSGGPGADTYVGEPRGGLDTIRWFETGTDKIDVGQFGWTSLAEMQSAGVVITPSTDSSGVASATVDFGNGDGFRVLGASTLGESDIVFGASGDPSDSASQATDLTGTSDADALEGTAAAETIDGKAGDDTLTGGAGADVFAFAQGYGTDTVTDFDAAADKIDLTAWGLGDMSGLTAAASVTSGANAVVLGFASGDQLMLTGIAKLNAEQIVF